LNAQLVYTFDNNLIFRIARPIISVFRLLASVVNQVQPKAVYSTERHERWDVFMALDRHAADKNVDNFTDSVIIHHVANSELRESRKVKQGVARSRHDN